MSETRALRDRLEQTQAELRRAKDHLEKLRVHQARERDSLRQQLEEARAEVAGLRGRLQELESPRVEPLPAPCAVLPEPAMAGERPATALIALVRIPDSLESALPKLAAVLKLAPVDVRFRLALMLPAVVARVPVSQAGEVRAALRAAGLPAVSHEVLPRWGNSWFNVRRFELEEQGLSLEGLPGQSLRVRYAELRLVVRGRQSTTHVETKEEVEHEYSGRGSRRVVKTVEEKHVRVESFLWVLGKGLRAAFTQSTQFMGLGGQLAPTVHENLQRLLGELRRRASHVVVDERLMQMPRFTLPLVEPGRSQELFAELLFQAVDEGLWV